MYRIFVFKNCNEYQWESYNSVQELEARKAAIIEMDDWEWTEVPEEATARTVDHDLAELCTELQLTKVNFDGSLDVFQAKIDFEEAFSVLRKYIPGINKEVNYCSYDVALVYICLMAANWKQGEGLTKGDRRCVNYCYSWTPTLGRVKQGFLRPCLNYIKSKAKGANPFAIAFWKEVSEFCDSRVNWHLDWNKYDIEL